MMTTGRILVAALLLPAVLLLCCSVQGSNAELVVTDAAGDSTTLLNMDLNFAGYEYDLLVHFKRFTFDERCTLVAPEGPPPDGALIDLKEAYAKGCNTLTDIAHELSGLHARPQVALVLSIENGDPSSFEAYGIHPLAHDTPFTDMIYTFIRRTDWEAELTSSDAFTARVSSNPSSLTETAASVLFKTGYGILIALFCIILLYSVGLLCWFRYHSVPLVNFRGYLLAAITVFCLSRIILHSCSPLATTGRLPYTMTEFLWWIGFLAGYVCLNVLFTMWARSSRVTTRSVRCGSRTVTVLTMSLIASAIGVTVLALLLILRTLKHVIYGVADAAFVVYGLLAPILLVQCLVFLVGGASLLHSLRGVVDAQTGRRAAITRKLTSWLVTVCALFLAFIVVMICYTVFYRAIPWNVIAFEWSCELITIIIMIAFILIVHANDVVGTSRQHSVSADEESGKRQTSVQLSSFAGNDASKDLDVSTPAQRELLSLTPT